MKSLNLLMVGLLAATSANAQKGVEDGSKYGHGEDSIRCIQNLVLYSDNVKMKNFVDAYEPWKIVFDECPCAKKTTLYTDGVKIAKALYQKASDDAQKEEYYNLLMKIYDQRIKYYGNDKKFPESYLNGMKAIDIVTYKTDNDSRMQAVKLFDSAFTGDPTTIQAAFVGQYIITCSNLFKAKAITGEQMVDSYLKATDVITKVLSVATDKNKEAAENTKVQVEQVFATSGAADCETLSKIFTPQLESNKADKDWLTRVNKILFRSGCNESDLYFATSECLYNIEPSAAAARGLANMNIKQKDFAKAYDFYNKAIELEDDVELKAKYCYELSYVYFSNGDLFKAKKAAYDAAKMREGWGGPFILLGKIYAAGSNHIGEKDYQKRACYWAAVDKFIKAKNVDSSEEIQTEANELIRQYSQHFPKKEDLFFEGIQDGSSYTVGGFIGESTTVRSKK